MISTNAPTVDWYAATVLRPEDQVLDSVCAVLADERPVPVRPWNGYTRAWEVRREGRRCAAVLAGGHEHPHVLGTGSDAPAVASLVRRFPHHVARVDVAVDTEDAGAFDRLRETLVRIADSYGVKTLDMLSPTDPDAGRTLYVGAEKSEHRGRLYEKGKQLRGKVDRPGWVRWELQVRPQKRPRREWAAAASPEDLLGAARWARLFARTTLALDPARPPVRTERVSDLEGALRACTAQYGGRLLELLAAHGGDVERFGWDLLTRIPESLSAKASVTSS